ncbi:bacillithiol system redox-active protein YtxJ [Sphingobacterium psychroaquaticum]|uniref:Bacillithiol system protein YtxJ n=1 Tax=Sphingobacterium psychroaquaticum TaxID=561061 RepID=A0A1X7K3V2_9SPHI|nr:bacillithiol system redox-active protein YtxJ [Sphingobacterium psychroaquaticum]SMG35286.1 bacillithiol system protein YtxJ [Sphingobacterium psychroaquaticum]
MNWESLQSLDQLQNLASSNRPFVVFKHSTRCSVSSMAKKSLEFDFDQLPAGAVIYFLDLIALRDISNFIAEHWAVKHESPQLLVLQGDSCLYHASHQDIELSEVLSFIS